MTITKNDFFTANNFKTLQDIGKKYPEWKDFCMEIVNLFDDKFGVTMLSETSGEIKLLVFVDYNMAESIVILGLAASELLKDKLYLYKMHDTIDGNNVELKSSELYNTGVNIDKPIKFTVKRKEVLNGVECDVIELNSFPYNYNVGDTLLSLESYISNELHNDIRMDYNGALYEVMKAAGAVLWLRAKDNVNTPFKETLTLFLYKKAK